MNINIYINYKIKKWLIFGMDRINVAVIGTNFGTKVHLPAFKLVEEVNVVGIYSRNWMEAIKNKNIQAISVAVPPAAAYDILSTAIKHGKHIFCEKPLCANLQQATEIAAMCNKDIIHAINFEISASKIVQQFKQKLNDKYLGKINSFSFTWKVMSGGYGWKLDINQGGGVLHNYCSHVFHLLEWLFNENIETLNGKLLPTITYNTYMEANIQFKTFSGSICIDSKAVPSGFELIVRCERGTYTLYNNTDALDAFSLLINEDGDETTFANTFKTLTNQDGRITLMGALARRFIDGIINTSQVSPNIADGVRTHVLADILLSKVK